MLWFTLACIARVLLFILFWSVWLCETISWLDCKTKTCARIKLKCSIRTTWKNNRNKFQINSADLMWTTNIQDNVKSEQHCHIMNLERRNIWVKPCSICTDCSFTINYISCLVSYFWFWMECSYACSCVCVCVCVCVCACVCACVCVCVSVCLSPGYNN